MGRSLDDFDFDIAKSQVIVLDCTLVLGYAVFSATFIDSTPLSRHISHSFVSSFAAASLVVHWHLSPRAPCVVGWIGSCRLV